MFQASRSRLGLDSEFNWRLTGSSVQHSLMSITAVQLPPGTGLPPSSQRLLVTVCQWHRNWQPLGRALLHWHWHWHAGGGNVRARRVRLGQAILSITGAGLWLWVTVTVSCPVCCSESHIPTLSGCQGLPMSISWWHRYYAFCHSAICADSRVVKVIVFITSKL